MHRRYWSRDCRGESRRVQNSPRWIDTARRPRPELFPHRRSIHSAAPRLGTHHWMSSPCTRAIQHRKRGSGRCSRSQTDSRRRFPSERRTSNSRCRAHRPRRRCLNSFRMRPLIGRTHCRRSCPYTRRLPGSCGTGGSLHRRLASGQGIPTRRCTGRRFRSLDRSSARRPNTRTCSSPNTARSRQRSLLRAVHRPA